MCCILLHLIHNAHKHCVIMNLPTKNIKIHTHRICLLRDMSNCTATTQIEIVKLHKLKLTYYCPSGRS